MSKISNSDTEESVSDHIVTAFTTISSTEETLHTALSRVPSQAITLVMGIALLSIAVGPTAAQTGVGDVYCGTGVDTGIDMVFGALAGLGLPATAFFVGRSGLSYMRAGGNPEKKNSAKEKLVMSGVGFGIIVLALLSPELIDKVGSQMGFGFSDCVKPF